MHRPTRSLAVILLTLTLTAIVSQAQAEQPAVGAGTTVYTPLLRTPSAALQTPEQQSIAQQVLDLVNAERASAGCPELTFNDALTRAAQGHSQDMAISNFHSHTNMRGEGPRDRARAAGYTSPVGENIAAGYSSAQSVMADWMRSSGHRSNILNCAYREIGIGYYYQSDDGNGVYLGTNSGGEPVYGGPFYRYWTQLFGRP